MRLQPAISDRAMHRRAVFSDIASCLKECVIDSSDQYPASTIGSKRDHFRVNSNFFSRGGTFLPFILLW